MKQGYCKQCSQNQKNVDLPSSFLTVFFGSQDLLEWLHSRLQSAKHLRYFSLFVSAKLTSGVFNIYLSNIHKRNINETKQKNGTDFLSKKDLQ